MLPSAQRTLATAARLIALLLAAAQSPAAFAQFSAPPGLLDHSLCCGPKAGINGDLSFDPALDGSSRRTGARHAALPPANPAHPPAKLEVVDGYVRAGFDVLGAFTFTPPADLSEEAAAKRPSALEQLPAHVRELDGKKVLLRGFMLPMKMEGTLTTEFLIVANSMLCCYGIVPPMNQWVVVHLPKGAKPIQDVPTEVYGTLRVKERFDNGMLSAIYHLDAERVKQPKT